MNKEQVKEMLDMIGHSYQGFVTKDNANSMLDMWLNELSQYDYEDVMEKLKRLMAEDKFQLKPPTLYFITAGLIKKHEKIDYTKGVFYCSQCGKAFNSDEEQKKHFDRCMSINYVIRETRKWFNKQLTRQELLSMSDNEFEERYNKLLKYIYNHTNDNSEKIRIGFIFNPPTKEEAQRFLKNM